MKKKNIFTGLIALLSLCTVSSCKNNGVEKEYTMDIKEAPIVARLKDDEEKEVLVAHCTRGMSLLNYYIELPEIDEAVEMPKQLVAKDTSDTTKRIIIVDGKSKTVSDYGYKFVKWPSAFIKIDNH